MKTISKPNKFMWGMGFFSAYCCLYLILSILGRFEPMVWGLNGPKWYAWAPLGFVKDMRWRQPMIYAFLPLWEADRFYWHAEDRSYSGIYPINLAGEKNNDRSANLANDKIPMAPETNQTPSNAGSSR